MSSWVNSETSKRMEKRLEAERDQWKAIALELGEALQEVGKLVDATPPEEFRYSDHVAITVNTALATLDKLTK